MVPALGRLRQGLDASSRVSLGCVLSSRPGHIVIPISRSQAKPNQNRRKDMSRQGSKMGKTGNQMGHRHTECRESNLGNDATMSENRNKTTKEH